MIFRKIDHIMISVLIAGTYTPVCLTALKGKVGFILLTAIWTLAIGGIILKIFFVNCPKWLSSAIYLIMGWLCVFALKPIYKTLPLSGFLWLLFGGVAYTLGAVIYVFKLKSFNKKHIYFGSHEIFHVFIMLGTFCHYMLLFTTLSFYWYKFVASIDVTYGFMIKLRCFIRRIYESIFNSFLSGCCTVSDSGGCFYIAVYCL